MSTRLLLLCDPLWCFVSCLRVRTEINDENEGCFSPALQRMPCHKTTILAACRLFPDVQVAASCQPASTPTAFFHPNSSCRSSRSANHRCPQDFVSDWPLLPLIRGCHVFYAEFHCHWQNAGRVELLLSCEAKLGPGRPGTRLVSVRGQTWSSCLRLTLPAQAVQPTFPSPYLVPSYDFKVPRVPSNNPSQERGNTSLPGQLFEVHGCLWNPSHLPKGLCNPLPWQSPFSPLFPSCNFPRAFTQSFARTGGGGTSLPGLRLTGACGTPPTFAQLCHRAIPFPF